MTRAEVIARARARLDGYDHTLERAKRQHITAVLLATDGNVSAAAEMLGIRRYTLQRMMRGMSGRK